MALTNIGFNGTVSAVGFAQRAQYEGVLWPVVGSRNDLAVAANPSATLTCTIQPGVSAGQGLITSSDSVASIPFDAVTINGQTRWDAVVLRRNWASSGSAAFVVVKGTPSANAPMVVPAGVDLTLDATHDHLLALVQITYGINIPTLVVDRRAQAHKVFSFPSVSALPPASNVLFGMEAVVADGSKWRCQLVAGSPSWVSADPVLPVHTPKSDAGFPAAATTATTATIVIDRFTIAPAPYARALQMVTHCYAVTNIDGTVVNLQLFAGSSAIGYARKRLELGQDQLMATGKADIPANSAVVVEARVNRFSGTGAFSTSTSTGLTNTNLLITRKD